MLELKGRRITQCWFLRGAYQSMLVLKGRRITQCWFLKVGVSLNAGS